MCVLSRFAAFSQLLPRFESYANIFLISKANFLAWLKKYSAWRSVVNPQNRLTKFRKTIIFYLSENPDQGNLNPDQGNLNPDPGNFSSFRCHCGHTYERNNFLVYQIVY